MVASANTKRARKLQEEYYRKTPPSEATKWGCTKYVLKHYYFSPFKIAIYIVIVIIFAIAMISIKFKHTVPTDETNKPAIVPTTNTQMPSETEIRNTINEALKPSRELKTDTSKIIFTPKNN